MKDSPTHSLTHCHSLSVSQSSVSVCLSVCLCRCRRCRCHCLCGHSLTVHSLTHSIAVARLRKKEGKEGTRIYLMIVRSFVRWFVRSFVRSFVRWFVRWFVRSFVRSLCSFVRCVRSFVQGREVDEGRGERTNGLSDDDDNYDDERCCSEGQRLTIRLRSTLQPQPRRTTATPTDGDRRHQ